MKGLSTMEIVVIVIMFIAAAFTIILLLLQLWPQLVQGSSKIAGEAGQNILPSIA